MRKKLTEDEVRAKLATLPAWSIRDAKLHRELVFRDFSEAFGFMARAALVAEKLDHHPEWLNVYNRVHVYLTTHDAGGISERDFDFAKAVDAIVGGQRQG